ncbi:AAA family ATPase [Phnomibacter ginsenosidimutans]|nr:AAA family ATPase [Phnomibacter ginsenosidimutans]
MKTYIRGIGVQNFKTYSKYQFCKFSSISFLIGKNGVGKSSFLQAAQFIFKYLKNPTAFRYFPDDDFQMIKNEKVVNDEVFSDNFTHLTQFINDTSKPLIIDLLIDFGFENDKFVISQLKYRFVFIVMTLDDEQYLFLDELNLFDTETNDLLFTNNYKQHNESYNINLTKEGRVFLLTSFLKYINKEDLPKPTRGNLNVLLGKETINDNKNSLKTKFGHLEKQFLYEIDEIEFSSPKQRFMPEHGLEPGAILTEVNLFNDEITSYFSNCSHELKEVLNLTYQGIKDSFQLNSKKLQEIETIKISEISSRKRTLNKDEVYLKCFSNPNSIEDEFLINNLKRFHFKGVPEILLISKDDKKYKAVLTSDQATKINLIDEGSGYWTLTYLILILGNKVNKNKIILIEEPETFLHPNFQANLADLFIEATEKFGLQLIIETHSEYLVKRLQRRISQTHRKDKLKTNLIEEQEPIPYDIFPSDISINYIHDEKSSNDIINIQIDKDGDLDRPFPTDFMDVSINEDLLFFKLKNLN